MNTEGPEMNPIMEWYEENMIENSYFPMKFPFIQRSSSQFSL